MDTSPNYLLMCQKAFEIQGKLSETLSKDVTGILQTRGILQGDFILSGVQRFEGYSQEVSVAIIDYKVIHSDEDELFYLRGREEYSYIMPFMGGAYGLNRDLGFPIWRDCDVFDEDVFSNLQYYLTSYSTPFVWWLPRQDQIQELFLPDLTNYAKARAFVDFLDTTAFDPTNYSLEILWLRFYMKEAHRKVWKLSGSTYDWVEFNL